MFTGAQSCSHWLRLGIMREEAVTWSYRALIERAKTRVRPEDGHWYHSLVSRNIQCIARATLTYQDRNKTGGRTLGA